MWVSICNEDTDPSYLFPITEKIPKRMSTLSKIFNKFYPTPSPFHFFLNIFSRAWILRTGKIPSVYCFDLSLQSKAFLVKTAINSWIGSTYFGNKCILLKRRNLAVVFWGKIKTDSKACRNNINSCQLGESVVLMCQRKTCTWTYSIQQFKCHPEYSIFLHKHLQSPKKVVLDQKLQPKMS